MAENKKGFVLYADQIGLFSQLPDDKAGQLIKHIYAYVNDQNPTTDDLVINIAFEPIKQQLKRDLKKFEEVRKKRSKAGKASAEKRATNSTHVESVEQKATNSTVIVKDNVNDKVNVNDSIVKTIPLWLDFFNYAEEKAVELNYDLDESKLKAKYLAWKEAGWQTGKNKKIKNWKSTLLNTLVYLRKDENQKQNERINIGDAEAWDKL